MQHEERETHIDALVQAMKRDLKPKTKARIIKNAYKPYSEEVILDLMARFSIQRRTAKSWLVCAQIRLAGGED